MSRDVVFVVSPRVGRNELQYALRSLNMVPHGRVWMIGGNPNWVVNTQHVPLTVPEKWTALTQVWDVIRDLPLTSEFIYTEDDYFITAPVDDIPNYHKGPLTELVDHNQKRATLTWRWSLKATYDLLVANGIPDPLSFDVHIPMVVEHDRIPNWSSKSVLRYRDLVGNTATRPAVQIRDVKVSARAGVERATASGFLSTSESSFVKSGAYDYLRTLFPEPCRYEKEFYMDSDNVAAEPVVADRVLRHQAKKDRIVERRITRNKPPVVKLDTGEWVDEDDYMSSQDDGGEEE